jgi:hypothetical protein
MTYTRDQILVLVNQRVPYFTSEQKDVLITSALSILVEPKYSNFADQPMVAVKIAIARLGL